MERKSQIKNLKTAKGQIEGIIKMLEEERNCIDVSNQLLATISILKNVNASVLTSHLTLCASDDKNTHSDERLSEIVKIIKKITMWLCF